MKFILISPKNRTAYNFRGDLIRKIIESGYEVIVTGPNRDNVEKIEALGARFVEIPMNKNGVNPLKDLEYQKALCDLFKQEKPDVTLGYTSKPVIYGSIAAKKAGVGHIVAMVTGAGYAFTAQTKKAKVIKTIMSVLYKRAFRCADVVIFQNNDDKAQFVSEHLVAEEKCRVVNGSGVNTERFPIAPYPEQMTFFMLSRVMYSKGIREYLKACEIVKEKHPEVRCMLLGACEGIQDSLSEADLQSYIDRGIIEHFGETDTVADYYKQCSVYVLPSYREGTPRTVLEAMSMGRAVITTDAPGCRETVQNGETGFLVPVKDADALAEKMLSFIENPQWVSEMGAKSAAYCRQKFDVNKVNADMCNYLNIKGEKENVLV
ncbi:MAG: glycosyltransferase family 4 protein [Clostridia bacterium]|nr:glycosyltransferase family 4 protein [Clostridia bacterium]